MPVRIDAARHVATSSGKSEPDTLVTGSVDSTAVTLRRVLGPNQQSYALTLSADGNRLDGFGEGYFLHHTNLNMTRSRDAKPVTAPPSTTPRRPPQCQFGDAELQSVASACLIAARARMRVESSVGSDETSSFTSKGISVHPSTTASQPSPLNLSITCWK